MRAWKANIDIQPVFNHYKAVTYICAHFSKAEDETSEAAKQAAKEVLSGNISHYEKMKAIAHMLQKGNALFRKQCIWLCQSFGYVKYFQK